MLYMFGRHASGYAQSLRQKDTDFKQKQVEKMGFHLNA